MVVSMKNKFNSKYTIYLANKTSSAPTREQITGAMENYLKSGGCIEQINEPQAGAFKQRAFLNSRAISPVLLKKNAGKIFRFPLAAQIVCRELT